MILINPPKPRGSNIMEFVHNKFRVVLLAGTESEPVPCDVAAECLRTYEFLDSRKYEGEQVVEEKDPETKDTPLDGFPNLGEKSINKLNDAEIYTREQFLGKMDSDPELIRVLVGPPVFSKLAEAMGITLDKEEEPKKEEK